jgi:hypothetical protein
MIIGELFYNLKRKHREAVKAEFDALSWHLSGMAREHIENLSEDNWFPGLNFKAKKDY